MERIGLQVLGVERDTEGEPREWDEYPEPLWDPVRAEASLLVKEYFAQADEADE